MLLIFLIKFLEQITILTRQIISQILMPANVKQQAIPIHHQIQPISIASSNEQISHPSSPQIITVPAPQIKLSIPFKQNKLPNQPISGEMSNSYQYPITILRDDPVKATSISARSNLLQQFLSVISKICYRN